MKILKAWLAVMAAYILMLNFLDHTEVAPSLFAVIAMETLSFFICLAIVRHEPNKKNRVVFLNFTFFFGLAFPGMIAQFLPPLFPENRYLELYLHQFLVIGPFGLVLTFSIVYLTIDVLFREFRIAAKYALAFAMAGGLFIFYFHPFLEDPKHVYHTQDCRDWKAVSVADSAFTANTGRQGSAEELAAGLNLYIYDGNDTVAVMQPEARERRVAQLIPYLQGTDFFTLLNKPVQMFLLRMSVACIGFILLFFGYLYMKDPPQGAYIEKIMFLFLVFCSMEVLHGWSLIKAVEWQSISQIFAAGQYASNLALVFIALYLSLRLRFITSVKGEFYESELSERPAGVTRWRDTLDNLVVEKFFNRQTLLGRMFAVPEDQQHATH